MCLHWILWLAWNNFFIYNFSLFILMCSSHVIGMNKKFSLRISLYRLIFFASHDQILFVSYCWHRNIRSGKTYVKFISSFKYDFTSVFGSNRLCTDFFPEIVFQSNILELSQKNQRYRWCKTYIIKASHVYQLVHSLSKIPNKTTEEEKQNHFIFVISHKFRKIYHDAWYAREGNFVWKEEECLNE